MEGSTTANPTGEQLDWWLAPMDGSPAAATGMFPYLQKKLGTFVQLEDWVGDRILFSARGHMWDVGFDASTRKPVGEPRQLTSGASQERRLSAARVAGELRFAVSVGSTTTHLWKLRMDSRRGKALDEMRPLCVPAVPNARPRALRTASCFPTCRVTRAESSMRIRDLITGKDALLLRVPGRPKPSPDGSQIGYSVYGERAIYIVPGTGGDATRLLNDGGVSTSNLWMVDRREKDRVLERSADSVSRCWTSQPGRQLCWCRIPRWIFMGLNCRPIKNGLLFTHRWREMSRYGSPLSRTAGPPMSHIGLR